MTNTRTAATLTAHGWLSALLDVAGSQPAGARVRQCPAHQDARPSLSVSAGTDGRALLRCFSGCTVHDILAALHCQPIRLFTPPPVAPQQYADMTRLRVEFPPVVIRQGHPAARGYRLEAIHDYGLALLERWRNRSGGKELLWTTRLADGTTGFGLIGATLSDLPLYREAEARRAVALGEPVLLVESESSCDALRGWYATTWAGGADAVNVARIVDLFAGYDRLVTIPDNDTAGRRWLHRLNAAGLDPAVLLGEPGEDARDLYARQGEPTFRSAVNRLLQRTVVPA